MSLGDDSRSIVDGSVVMTRTSRRFIINPGSRAREIIREAGPLQLANLLRC